eukprot:7968187-Pyramimonas_sp.AAC.1
MDSVNRMRETSNPGALPDDMRGGEAELRGSLTDFYIAWDPYQGTDESWAPDYVSEAPRRARADPERHRFQPPPPPAVSVPGVARDPDAEPGDPGPIEAAEEQEYAEALAFIEGTPIPDRDAA